MTDQRKTLTNEIDSISQEIVNQRMNYQKLIDALSEEVKAVNQQQQSLILRLDVTEQEMETVATSIRNLSLQVSKIKQKSSFIRILNWDPGEVLFL